MKQIAHLHAITQDLPSIPHAEQAYRACEGGAKWIQLRVKQASDSDRLAEARATQAHCRKAGATLIINDHVALAKEIGADGVHLGKSDMSPVEARALLGPDFMIGGTANTFEDIKRLAQQQVDYIGLGPFRFTATKQNLSPILGLEGYRKIVAQCVAAGIHLPIVAIGGITVADVAAIRETGVHGVAISSAINCAANPVAAAREFCQALDQSSRRHASLA